MDCLDQFLLKSLIDGIAQITDIYIHDIRSGVEIISPDVLQNAAAGEDLVLILQTELEKFQFFRAQFKFRAVTLDTAAVHIHREIAGLEDSHPVDARSAQQGAD